MPEDVVYCLRRPMSNQACPGVPTAAIGKMGVPSVSGGYGAADTLSDDRIDATGQRTCHRGAFAW